MPVTRPWRWFALLVALALVVTACGRFDRRSGDDVSAGHDERTRSPTTTSLPPDRPDVAPESTSPSASQATQPPPPPPTRTPDDGSRPPVTGRTVVRTGVANQSVVDHPGWRVTLTVGDRAEYGTADTVPIEVALTNTADVVRHHEIDQPDSVVITTVDEPDQRAWSHLECNPTLGVYEQSGGLRALGPREQVSMIVRYPLVDDCRLPPGDYLVFGQWSVCPDDARRETANPGTFVCDDGRAVLVDAGPVFLRLR